MKEIFSIFFLALTLSFHPLQLHSQSCDTWQHIFGSPCSNFSTAPGEIQKVGDEGFIITGRYYNDLCYADLYIVKTDENGNAQWIKDYSSDNLACGGLSIQSLQNGNYILGCQYKNGSHLMLLNNVGDTLWDKYITDPALHVEQTSDLGFILTGITGLSLDPIYLKKTDASGNIEWEKYYSQGQMANDHGAYVTQTSDGGYILVGTSQKPTGSQDYDIYVLKTNSSGDSLWTRILGKTGINETEWGNSVIVNSDGDYIILGSSYDSVFLTKIDVNGNLIWQKLYPGATQYFASMDFCQTNDGGYAFTWGNNIIRTDADGNLVWKSELNYGLLAALTSISQTSEGCLVAGGWIDTTSNHSIWLIKVDENGVLQVQSIEGHSTNVEIFPNPVQTYLNISMDKTETKIDELTIRNILGESVYAMIESRGNLSIDLSMIASGIYFIELKTSDQVINRKFEKL